MTDEMVPVAEDAMPDRAGSERSTPVGTAPLPRTPQGKDQDAESDSAGPHWADMGDGKRILCEWGCEKEPMHPYFTGCRITSWTITAREVPDNAR